MRRAAAGFAMAALLFCSGAGRCWRELPAVTSAKHDCCAKAGDRVGGGKPCPAPFKEMGTAALVAAPTPAVLVHELPPAPRAVSARGAFDAAFPVLRPPLVLRI